MAVKFIVMVDAKRDEKLQQLLWVILKKELST